MVDLQTANARIHRNSTVLAGKPIIRGTRIAVSLVLDWIDSGVSIDQILEDYPNLTRADIEAAVAYGRQDGVTFDHQSRCS